MPIWYTLIPKTYLRPGFEGGDHVFGIEIRIKQSFPVSKIIRIYFSTTTIVCVKVGFEACILVLAHTADRLYSG